MLKGTQAYVQTKFSTVGQGEILILLYDGAIKFLTLAKEKIREKDPAAKGQLISKALDIVNELDGSINMEAGGSLSKNLHQLYFVCSTRLLKANLHMDIAGIDSVIGILSGLRNAYADILNKPEAKAASAKIASRMPANAATPQRAVPLPKPLAPNAGLGGRLQAQNSYAQPMEAAGLAAASSNVGANLGTNLGANLGANLAAAAPASPAMPASTPAMPASPAGQALADIPPAAPLSTPPPVNLENRRFAAAARYGKIAQTM